MKLVTFNFLVVSNHKNYIGTRFNETHLIDENVCFLSWAKANLPKYFGFDFKLLNIEK